MTRDDIRSEIDTLIREVRRCDEPDRDDIAGILSSLWLTIQSGTTAGLRELTRRHAMSDFMAASAIRREQGFDV